MCQALLYALYTYYLIKSLTAALWERYYYYSYFTEEETGSKRWVTKVTEVISEWDSNQSASRAHGLNHINYIFSFNFQWYFSREKFFNWLKNANK